MLWLWGWGLPPPDRGRSRGHRSYLRRVCRLKEEGRQLKCQHKNRKSRAIQSGILLRSIHCSILHALLPKCRETCEGGSGLVGPESNGRGRLSEIKEYTGATIESYESRTAHFLYLLRLQGEQLSLQHSVFATTPAGWCIGLTVIGPRSMTLRLERPISRDTRSVAFPFS